MEFELTVLERLAERYGTRKGLWGIEILNEPILGDMWESMKDTERYPAVDPRKLKEQAADNGIHLWSLSGSIRQNPQTYVGIKYVVFHDAFCSKHGRFLMREDKYKNVVLDIFISI